MTLAIKNRDSKAALALTLACGLLATSAHATGPNQQQVAWQAQTGNLARLDSVVRISAGGFFGTGSIINKTQGADGNLWVTILTADHVAAPGGYNAFSPGGGHTIQFGNGPTPGAKTIPALTPAAGGNPARANTWYRQFPGEDLAIIQANLGPANGANQTFFNDIAKFGFAAFPNSNGVPTTSNNQFTLVGYGDTGEFDTVGGNGGLQGQPHNRMKRFSNNTIDSAGTVNAGGYNYASINWDLDRAPAPAGGMNPVHPFLVGEGISFGGDSGGPYLSNDLKGIWVPGFSRDGGVNDPNNWLTDDMPLLTDTIFAVHTRGNANSGGFNRYGLTTATGLPLMPKHIDWINGQIAATPTPGTAALLTLGGVLAARRRRLR